MTNENPLQTLEVGVDAFSEMATTDSSLAMLTIGIHVLDNSDPDDQEIGTFINVVGSTGVIAEGLYAELAGQIEAGELTLATIFADVVRDLQKDFNINLSSDANVVDFAAAKNQKKPKPSGNVH